MSRWYSKQRKNRMSAELMMLGFIPARGAISKEIRKGFFGSLANGYNYIPPEEADEHFECKCYICKVNGNKKGIFEINRSIHSSYEYPEEDDEVFACRKCLRSRYYRNAICEESTYSGYSNLAQWRFVNFLKPDEKICSYCDGKYTGKCGCGFSTMIQNAKETVEQSN